MIYGDSLITWGLTHLSGPSINNISSITNTCSVFAAQDDQFGFIITYSLSREVVASL